MDNLVYVILFIWFWILGFSLSVVKEAKDFGRLTALDIAFLFILWPYIYTVVQVMIFLDGIQVWKKKR